MSRLALAACSLLLTSSALMGCILRDFDYDPPKNRPPSVESVANGLTPLNRVLLVNLSQEPGGDAGLPNDLRFEAEIRDLDVAQALEARVYVDSELVVEYPIPPTIDAADPRRRPFSFTISRTGIPPGCHLVELLVSSESGFEFLPSRNPREAGDIGSGQWWIAATSDAQPIVDMALCLRVMQ